MEKDNLPKIPFDSHPQAEGVDPKFTAVDVIAPPGREVQKAVAAEGRRQSCSGQSCAKLR